MDDDEMALGAFADAEGAHARQVAAGLRPARPGRPKGAANKRTTEFEEWFRASGREDPLLGLADFYSTDPVHLQAWFEEHERSVTAVGKQVRKTLPSLLDIIKAQNAARAELAPYLHGKMPIRVKIEDERLPVLVLNLGTNQLDQARVIEGQRRFSVGLPLGSEASEINHLDDATKSGGESDASE